MTAQGKRLFSQFTFAFHVFQERLPLRSATKAVGFYTFVINELGRIAVIEIVATIVNDLAIDFLTAEYEVIKHLTTDEADEGGPT